MLDDDFLHARSLVSTFESATRALPDAAATDRLGRALAAALRTHWPAIQAQGLQIDLRGDLGSGKTAVVRALLRSLGVTGPVRSPSFTLLEPYAISSLDFYHFDFYRFEDPEEFADAGFREMFGPGRISAVEWPENARGLLPPADLVLALEIDGDGRRVSIEARSELGAACLRNALVTFEAGAT